MPTRPSWETRAQTGVGPVGGRAPVSPAIAARGATKISAAKTADQAKSPPVARGARHAHSAAAPPIRAETVQAIRRVARAGPIGVEPASRPTGVGPEPGAPTDIAAAAMATAPPDHGPAARGVSAGAEPQPEPARGPTIGGAVAARGDPETHLLGRKGRDGGWFPVGALMGRRIGGSDGVPRVKPMPRARTATVGSQVGTGRGRAEGLTVPRGALGHLSGLRVAAPRELDQA